MDFKYEILRILEVSKKYFIYTFLSFKILNRGGNQNFFKKLSEFIIRDERNLFFQFFL